MIDVVFVIMLFFMVMAGVMKTEATLPARLPGTFSDAHVKSPDLDVLVGVCEDGTITLNDEIFDSPSSKALPAFTATLQRLKTAADLQHDQVLVSIQAEPDARYERIVDVLDGLAKSGITNVTFATVE